MGAHHGGQRHPYTLEEIAAARACGCYCCLLKVPSPFQSGLSNSAARDMFVVCRLCGNKRCPHATHHARPCSGSNEPGQDGSRFKAGWKEPEAGGVELPAAKESPEIIAARAAAAHNLGWLAGIILKAGQGSEGDAATLRIFIAKIAGAVGHPELMNLASTVLAIGQAESRKINQPGPVLTMAAAAQKIYKTGTTDGGGVASSQGT